MPTNERRLKTPDEIREYKEYMEKNVRGFAWLLDGSIPDPYDKGWYDAIRWMLGEYP
jgi:hypothetical protein